MKQNLIEKIGYIDNLTIIQRYINASLLKMSKTSRKKTVYRRLENIMNQTDLSIIYRALYPTIGESIFF